MIVVLALEAEQPWCYSYYFPLLGAGWCAAPEPREYALGIVTTTITMVRL
jgi:hypothetical protein